jgi:DNA-binding NarL/FixJ family response regulator
VVIDAQPFYRLGVAHALNASRIFTIVGEGATADDAGTLAGQLTPDFLFTDTQNGSFSAAEAVITASPSTKTVILTDLTARESIERAFQLGVRGYLTKSTTPKELLRATRIIARGGAYLSQHLVSRVFMAKPSNAEHTDLLIKFAKREEEILDLLASGCSNKEIAFRIGVSEKTVKYYMTLLMKKIKARNRVEAALFASRRRSPGIAS